jgi:hypothetical protein
MKATEAAALLTIAAAFDNRKPDADQAKAWALALDGFRFEDCREAIVAHYRTSREWMMPADVIGGVKRLRAKRISEFGTLPDPPPELDPDDTRALAAWMRQTRAAIGDGTYEATPDAEVTPINRDVIKELGYVGRHVDDEPEETA